MEIRDRLQQEKMPCHVRRAGGKRDKRAVGSRFVRSKYQKQAEREMRKQHPGSVF